MSQSGATAIIIFRHGERMDAVDKNWMASNPDRPFDPPLTKRGELMASKAGAAIQSIIEQEGLPPVAKLLSSPLVRCIQTAIEAGKSLKFEGKVEPEPALSEIIWEEWYRSWGVPGTSGEWGGPPHCGLGVPVALEDLHPAALRPAGELYLSPAELQRQFGDAVAGSEEYQPSVPAASLKYCWGNVETKEDSRLRVGKFAESYSAQNEGKTVVMCSHGGPTSLLYQHLSNNHEGLETGYTAIFAFVKDGAGWKVLRTACTAHLGEVDAVELGLQYAQTK
eukprot:CAMPEP_0181299058 /NCGR_PEP_ID=MMETSP1101-20121128/6128_1 /TAXON_ID=46948 /ORGANISM="Rhodomonas abbreviata, Strain Caron Lab Isolate" /LENGTH=278 /DNA_ID=CAMNT_0023404151 /DNA_START=11 /DNA_END=847 /DNA_ORIENTATION=+